MVFQAENLELIFLLIFQGAHFAWKATAMGKNYINGKTFLEKRYVVGFEFYLFMNHTRPIYVYNCSTRQLLASQSRSCL